MLGADGGAAYSGILVDKIHMQAAAKSLAESRDTLGLIDKTPVGQFLDSPEFKDHALSLIESRSITSNDVYGTKGLWADASTRYIGDLQGAVYAFTPNAQGNRPKTRPFPSCGIPNP